MTTTRRRRRSSNPPLYLLTGFVLGLILGGAYAWLISPVELVDGAPAALTGQDQDRYRTMIALAYQADGNLKRARQRLDLLKDPNSPLTVAAEAQRLAAVTDNEAQAEAQALALLAAALSPQSAPTLQPSLTPAPTSTATLPALEVSPSATLAPGEAVRTPTPIPTPTATITPTATMTPIVTFTPRYTVQPTATLGLPFSLKNMRQVCDASLPQGLLQVEVDDRAGNGVPGVRILVAWPDNNQDTFYTGLMPEFGPGYADFVMSPKIIYSVRAGDSGQVVQGVSLPTCGSGSSAYPGGWKLTFSQ